MNRILIVDNYDSFTYNLVHLIEKVSDFPFDVLRNDEIALSEINTYDHILLSPGPGLPKNAGIMPSLLKEFAPYKKIFGVCLGMQAIGEQFNSPLKNLNAVFHGVATPIKVCENDLLFNNCPETFLVGRYHSWVIDEKKVSSELVVTAKDGQGAVMAVRHRHFNVRGVQFHPESILSEYGEQIISNWLKD